MHRLPANTVQLYNDGPDAPWTPILAEAERAYRHAYSIGAWQTLRWQEPDDDLIEKLRMARKAERQLAEVYVPSSFMFGDLRMDSEQIVYREGARHRRGAGSREASGGRTRPTVLVRAGRPWLPRGRHCPTGVQALI